MENGGVNFGGIEIYVNAASKTGLSALEGDSLVSVSQLPEFYVELHVFKSADEAAAFVGGLETAGLGNAMAYDWNPGTIESNRCVIVTRMDEPRPDADALEDAIKVVEYAATGHDGRAGAAHHKRTMEERRLEQLRQEEEFQPLKDALAPLGPSYSRSGRGWVQFGLDGEGVVLHWEDIAGPFSMTVMADDFFQGNVDATGAVSEAAAGFGFKLELDERHFVVEGIPDHGVLIDHLRNIKPAVDACMTAQRKVWHEDLVSRTKMTAARRRFLRAGHEGGGIRMYEHRRNKKARAGGVEIGATEIDTLVRVGWIAAGPSGYAVTEAGKAAAGITN